MVTETNPFPDRDANERSLCSTGTFSLDFKPVIAAVDSLRFRNHEECNACQKKTAELTMLMNSLSSDNVKTTKLLLGIQACLQVFEEQQRKLSEQYIRNRFIKPFARKLLGLRASIADFIEDASIISFIAGIIDDILWDFDIEIIEPKKGDKFDHETMRAHVVGPEKKTVEWIVQELFQPGARYGNYTLEYAQVKLVDRVDYVEPSSRQEAPFLLDLEASRFE